MIERILSFLFPPRLPGGVSNWGNRVEHHFDEQGSAGPAKPKQYRNGIERHFAENQEAFEEQESEESIFLLTEY